MAALGLVRWYMRVDDRVLWYQTDVQNLVALPIDDGPAAGIEILDVLDEHGAKATFFLIGSHAAREGENRSADLCEGHEVGSHMLFDQPSAPLSPEAFRGASDRSDSSIFAARSSPGAFLRPSLRISVSIDESW